MKKVINFILSLFIACMLVNCSTGPEVPIKVTDIDGNVYETVKIGNQVWMAENLRVTHYRNGDEIQKVTTLSYWENLTTGAYSIYNNYYPYIETNGFGNLYNWYAVDDPRGLAPEGWHIPTDEEIMELEMALGMSESDANKSYSSSRGTNEGSKLAGDSYYWTNGDLENDPDFGSSGFDLLPSGIFYIGFGYAWINDRGVLWSSSEINDNSACYRSFIYSETYIYRAFYTKKSGFSVRCVKD
ncbi:MAG: fibrobacter succinogenes major paralogous domain-containing protein [Bacteroidales bacterium]|nr:fibrobacter succinogenes major paralogous domain-containing protein [Bacteroidales bacterium]